MTTTQPVKNRKIPYLNWHSIARNACATTKVKSMFTETVILCSAEHVSRGKISLGTSQPKGLHDQANAET